MTIKEVEKKTGLTTKSIRFYEEKGLINIERNTNDYRSYNDDDIVRLKLIKILRYLDYSVDEISKIIDDKNMLINSLEAKSIELENQSEKYIEKRNICDTLCREKKKDLSKIIEEYNETINFLESEDGYNIKMDLKEALCPSFSSLVVQTLIFLAPIIWLFIHILNKAYETLIANSIIAIICTGILVLNWSNYFHYKSKHKNMQKEKNKNNLLVLPVLLITVIISIGVFILFSLLIELMAPKDYLFYETSYFSTGLMIIIITITTIIVLALLLRKFGIKKTESLDTYLDLWDNYKIVYIILFLVISYIFITNVTFVTDNKIIYKNPLNPIGIIYDYKDIDLIETGFGKKIFSIFEYNRKGEFYYKINIDNKKIIFHVPSVNSKIERYNNDTYLELEEFDKKLVELGINKISDIKYSNLCNLDKQYCDRFIRIINNNVNF